MKVVFRAVRFRTIGEGGRAGGEPLRPGRAYELLTMSATLPIELDRAAAEPLYRQVASSVRKAIDAGRLRPGERVPSVRALASQLDIGRLTVATAYEQLAADGYLVSRMGFGTIVAPHPPDAIRPSNRFGRPGVEIAAGGGAARGTVATAAGRPIRLPPIRPLLASAAESMLGRNPAARRSIGPLLRFDLRSAGPGGSGSAGGPGLSVGPALERLLRSEWRTLAESAGSAATADPAGDPFLRAAIAAHLRASRAATCEPGQVVILSGPVIAMGAVSRLWLGPDRRAMVEDPGDPTFRGALAVTGAKIVAVPVDGNGVRVEQLPDDVAVALVSPSVHVPTGVGMPLARRLRLLAWAGASGAIVVEDGRSDELTIGGPPPACLQGLDGDGRVIHVGSFESLLHGGVRVGFAVVPDTFVDSFVGALDAIDPGPSPVQQRALGTFLADGHLDRHLARVRRALRERQEATVGALERDFGWLVDVHAGGGGTRLIATIQDPAWTAADVIGIAAEAGIAIDSLSNSRVATAPDRDLVIDFSHHEPGELRAAIRALAQAIASPDALIRRRLAMGRRPQRPPTPSPEFRVS
jgi:GntR family transcriptional regulator/MocR family aminotransferase